MGWVGGFGGIVRSREEGWDCSESVFCADDRLGCVVEKKNETPSYRWVSVMWKKTSMWLSKA